MGYNTTIFVLNDGFGQIEKNPDEFVKGIARHMHRGGEFGVGNHCNSVTVMRSEHADAFRLYGSHGNLMIELSPWSTETGQLRRTHPDLVRSYIERARELLTHLEADLNNGSGAGQ